MAEIKIPVVHFTSDEITVIGTNCLFSDAISLVPLNQRSHIQQTISDGILYLQGPAEELNRLVPVIKKVLTEHANWLLSQADNIKISETVTKL